MRPTAALRLRFAAQEERDHRVRLHRRGDSDAGRGRRSTFADRRLSVADCDYVAHLSDSHRIRAPPTCKTARRYELLARRSERRDKHHLRVDDIERLDDNVAVRKDFPRGRRVKPHVHGANVGGRVDKMHAVHGRGRPLVELAWNVFDCEILFPRKVDAVGDRVRNGFTEHAVPAFLHELVGESEQVVYVDQAKCPKREGKILVELGAQAFRLHAELLFLLYE